MSNKVLAKKSHKPIISKLEKNESVLIFDMQYLGGWSCWFPINK